MNKHTTFTFPVGYHKFHKKQVFNFQLNRWHSLGYARFEDMKEAGQQIKTFEDWKTEMLHLAAKAEEEKRWMNAAFYYRAAEFYMLKDNDEKRQLYDKFIALFYEAFKNDAIEKFEVPYQDGFLPVMKIAPNASGKKGTIVIHGGFDSFIEEFYSWMTYFSDQGYEVIAFEGPGQGGARRKYDLAFTLEWETPAKAILDYFKLDDVTWIGISMGGWLCFRAAAYEKRIKRVIASSIAYDYMKGYNVIIRVSHSYFIKHMRDYSNKMILKQLKKGGMQAWMAAQLMYITKNDMPVDAFQVWLDLNEQNLKSELVDQDVLILTGRDDHFIPFKSHAMQVNALTNAKSLTPIVFTKETHANNHCQIGNMNLALSTMVKWIEEKT
jgi:pimeloyl-ACP methyl ester carboxylesterase